MVRRWGLSILWASLPVTAGPAFDVALSDRSAVFASSASLAMWVVWSLVLVAILVPRTATLTAVRIVVPASFAASSWAALATSEPSWRDALALGATALATVVALAAPTGQRFVNGSAYGAERRFPLRPPGPLLLGPVEVVWSLTIIGAVAGPLLLAVGVPLAGLGAAIVGWPIAWAGARSLHRLAERWLVFVPAGLVLVDPLVLADNVLMQRRKLVRLGLAPSDTDAEDLTGAALGLAVEARFTEPETLTLGPPRRRGATSRAQREVSAVLFAPTRPGAVLTEARARRLPVG